MERIHTDVDALANVITGLRNSGKRVVLAVGSFDLFHAGHVSYLEDARHRGDYLIVGVQLDEAVRRTKGAGRPLFTAEDRAKVLVALSCVHYVTFFGETDASALVRKLRPDVVVRGHDVTEQTMPERQAADEVGAKVMVVGDTNIFSAKEILEKAKKRSPPRVARP